jgi:hypothetical protein
MLSAQIVKFEEDSAELRVLIRPDPSLGLERSWDCIGFPEALA